MICPHCGNEHPEKARFCPVTGETIADPQKDNHIDMLHTAHDHGGSDLQERENDAISRQGDAHQDENFEDMFGPEPSMEETFITGMSDLPNEPVGSGLCPHCGRLHKAGAKFCPVTGQTIEVVQAAAAEEMPVVEESVPEEETAVAEEVGPVDTEPATAAIPADNVCPHCGRLHKAGAKFCPVTGQTIEAVQAAAAEEMPVMEESAPEEETAVAEEVAPTEEQPAAAAIPADNVCPHCGRLHKAGAKFCPVTGQTIETVPAAAAEEMPVVEESALEEETAVAEEVALTEEQPAAIAMPADNVCPHCGRQHKAGAKFCPVTGQTIEAVPAAAAEEIPVVEESAPVEETAVAEEVAAEETPAEVEEPAPVVEKPAVAPAATPAGNVCPHCGRQHKAGARFCPVTGEVIEVSQKHVPVAVEETPAVVEEPAPVVEKPAVAPAAMPAGNVCPHCGRQHKAGAKFCPVTGQIIAAQTAAIESVSPEVSQTIAAQEEVLESVQGDGQPIADSREIYVPGQVQPLKEIRLDSVESTGLIIDALRKNRLVMLELPTVFAYLAAPTNISIGMLNEAKQCLPDKFYGSVAGSFKSLYINSDQTSIPDQFVRFHLWSLFTDAILRAPLSRVEPFRPQMVHNRTHQVLVLTDYLYQNLFDEIETELGNWLNPAGSAEKRYTASLLSGINISGKEAPISDRRMAAHRARELSDMVALIVTAPDYRKVDGQSYPIFDISEKRITIHRHGYNEASITNRLAEMGISAHYASDAALVKEQRGHRPAPDFMEMDEIEAEEEHETQPGIQLEAVQTLPPMPDYFSPEPRQIKPPQPKVETTTLNRFRADASSQAKPAKMNMRLRGRRVNLSLVYWALGALGLIGVLFGVYFLWQNGQQADAADQQVAEMVMGETPVEGVDSALLPENADVSAAPAEGQAAGIPLALEGKGKLAYMAASDSGTNVLTMLDLAGLGDSVVITDPASQDFYVDPDWSPDGTRIAFYSYSGQMYVIDAQVGAPPTALQNCMGPSWSGDGSQIICRNGEQSQFDIVSVQGGTAPQSVTLTNQGISPDWSPISNEVVYTVLENTLSRIWIMPVLTEGEPKMLAGESTENDAAEWSPDGNSIAFQSNKSGQTEVWVMDRQGQNQRQITNTVAGGWTSAPSWSPDGQMLAYVTSQAGSIGADYGEIFVIPLAGGEPIQLTYTGGKVHRQSLSWGK